MYLLSIFLFAFCFIFIIMAILLMIFNKINKSAIMILVLFATVVLVFAICTVKDASHASTIQVLQYQKDFAKCMILKNKNCDQRLVTEYKRTINKLYKERNEGNFWINDNIDDLKEIMEICKTKVGQNEQSEQ